MIDEKKFNILRGIVMASYLPNEEKKEMLDFLTGLSEQPKADWIPCEVQLPPKPRFSEDSYLVKTQCVTTPYTAYWNGEKWTDVLDDDIEDVIAWCQIPPYPQPYKERRCRVMADMCGDNRFEIIEKAKKDLLESTNIQTSKDEMQVLDDFLFRCWQMDWLGKYDQPMTNADRIRNMTDEELAKLLQEAEDCGYRDASITPIKDGGYMDMLEWLQAEVKEGAENGNR